MPLKRFLKGAVFSPDEIKIVAEAFDGLCNRLGLADRDDPLVEIVAVAIIQAAQHGMGTAEQIERRALVALTSVRSTPASQPTP